MSWISPDEDELELEARKKGVGVINHLLFYKYVKKNRTTTVMYWMMIILYYAVLISIYIMLNQKIG